jgi:hypothetical protein
MIPTFLVILNCYAGWLLCNVKWNQSIQKDGAVFVFAVIQFTEVASERSLDP